MNRYIVLRTIDHNGLRFPGEIVELTPEQAKTLPVRLYQPEPVAETAELHLENLETTDAKPTVGKGRSNANPARKHPK